MEKIQTLAEYQQLAQRTCPSLGSEQNDIVHMQLGLLTEIGEALDIFKKKHAYNKEMDLVNLGEELADQMWYLANLAIFKKDAIFDHADLVTLGQVVKDNFLIPATPQKKFDATVNILTNLLRHILGEKFDFIFYLSSIVAVCEIYELDFMQILTNNITKLQVRYPEKFSNEAALNRDLKAERKELEKVTPVKLPAEAVEENIEGRV